MYIQIIDDLSIALSACHTGCCVSNTIMNHFVYADDLGIFSPSSVGLRALIAVCEQYGISHDIRFNHKKSAIMIGRGHYMKNVYPPLYTLNGEVIKEVDSVRYLGHIISSNGKDDKDIVRQCQQLYARGNVLLRKFHMCSMDVKVKLFNTYCSPMYTAQLWWNHTVYSFHRLNVCYNNILRRLLRRPRYCSASGLFAECGIPNCKAVIRIMKLYLNVLLTSFAFFCRVAFSWHPPVFFSSVIRSLIYKFMSRLNESTNDVILAILSSDIRWTSRIRRYWVKTLYVHHDLV